MLRNLPHIAGMAFNQPLLLEPAYARVFFCALADQLGIRAVRDASGESLGIQGELSSFGESLSAREQRSYVVTDRIAILPISGTLVNKTSSLQPYSGMTGYNGIIARLNQAMSDPEVDGVMLDMDTPGGMVSGAFDCSDVIARMRDIKPIWALSNDMNCSAGQLIASAASRRLVTQTAATGSIGVLVAHSNYAGALDQAGVEITLIHSGIHKVAGNPYESLPDPVRARIQSQIDTLRQQFAEKVAGYTGLSVEKVLATEAAVYTGAQALDVGLADELVINSDAIAVMREALNKSKIIITGGKMSGQDQANQQAQAAELTQSHESHEAEVPVTDIANQIASAVTNENTRIMSILGCDEAKGREEQAKALAATPGMTMDDARRIMAVSPQSAQVRSETSLDTMMATAPSSVSAASGQGNADNDLMNIPV